VAGIDGIDGMGWTAFIFLQETRRVPVYVFFAEARAKVVLAR
jgi:hypothetical protein